MPPPHVEDFTEIVFGPGGKLLAQLSHQIIAVHVVSTPYAMVCSQRQGSAGAHNGVEAASTTSCIVERVIAK